MTHDKIYYFLPFWDDKPCMHVNSVWPDYRRRMYNSNIISKIVDRMVCRDKTILLIRDHRLASDLSGGGLVGSSIVYGGRRRKCGKIFKSTP